METETLPGFTPDPPTFELGTRVRYSHTLRREREGLRIIGPARDWGSVPGYTLKTWLAEPNACAGIIVGARTLADGRLDWDHYAGPFLPSRHFPAYLVAFHLYRKPVLVLPEHLTLR